MIIDEDDYLAHYGILRKSGRYPWGSGGTQSERNQTFLDTVESLRRQGMSEVDIAKGFKITTTQLRAAKSIANNEEKQSRIGQAQRLKDKGYSNVAIGARMGIPESSVRALLAPGQKDRADVLINTSNVLKDQIAEKKYLDVGIGTERHMNVSQTKLATAVARLQEEGYTVHYVKVQQLGTGQQTTIKVLAAPGTTYGEVYRNRGDIKTITERSDDGGRTYFGIQPPISVNSKRIQVRYANEGGADADGVIYVRPGVKDLSLGGSRYAQVRVAVDGTHYLKGMAVYKDDLPDGVDLIVNVNKTNTGNKKDAFKELKDDPDNPFGAIVSQLPKLDRKGNPIPNTVRSAMNMVNEQGDWEKWSSTLSSQMLSKQSPSLAKAQLDVMFERKKKEFDEIMALTNPTVRQRLLSSFSEDADSAAVHLKAAGLPRTSNHVIIPFNSMKDNEVYAPNFKNGETVVLIRHPHGGIFEIPQLRVNNRHPEARKVLGTDTKDAIGINSRVAQRLSGADFDGDTVLVIPNNSGKIKSAPALDSLKGFDPKASFPGYDGMPRMTPKQKAFEMGDVSNLITDMTIRGANMSEIARAVRHSMVVIDAEKHELNWKESARVNGIAQLKAKYQGSSRAGASTLVSRATSPIRVPERKQGFRIDPDTGKKIHTPTGATFVDDKGKVHIRTTKSKKLAETDDASTLSSGTLIEKIYSDHSNRLKALANQARREVVNTKGITYSTAAKATYRNEVESLNAKLNLALRNAPLERNAQVLANAIVAQKMRTNPNMEETEIKKIKSQALTEARNRTGAKKQRIELTDREWEAIQAGAIFNNKLSQILNNANLDQIKELATPRAKVLMTATKQRRATAMLASGYTQAEVAEALGVSLTTLKTSLTS